MQLTELNYRGEHDVCSKVLFIGTDASTTITEYREKHRHIFIASKTNLCWYDYDNNTYEVDVASKTCPVNIKAFTSLESRKCFYTISFKAILTIIMVHSVFLYFSTSSM